MDRLILPFFVYLGLLSILVACGPASRIQVEDRRTVTQAEESDRIGGQLMRIIQPGDTLYSIAFVQGVSVKELAAWNQINVESRLRIGQRLRLKAPLGFKPVPKTSNTATSSTRISKPNIGNRSAPASPRRDNGGDNTGTPKTGTPKSSTSSIWRWPVRGEVINRFSFAKRQQGIDIKAKKGTPVLVSKAGRVVYVGNGLAGYGNLIIVKHDDRYLSAYAHNQKSFVSEGQSVTAQQRIGTVGVNQKKQSALHFQIRKDGSPVDPLRYLKRQ